MAQAREVHGTLVGAAIGSVTGLTLAVAVLAVALIIGGIVLLVT